MSRLGFYGDGQGNMAAEVNQSEEATIATGGEVQQRIYDLITLVEEAGEVTLDKATLVELQAALTATSEPQSEGPSGVSAALTRDSAGSASAAVGAIDKNFASWQAKIVLAMDESIHAELRQQFAQANEMSSQLSKSLDALLARQHELDDKALAVETRLSQALLKEAETSRIRKSLAKQMWAQKAQALAELEEVREQQLDTLRQDARTAAESEINALQSRLEGEVSEAERLKTQSETAERSLAETKGELEEAQAELATAEKTLEVAHEQLGIAEEQAETTKGELESANAELKSLREELEATHHDIASEKNGLKELGEELSDAKGKLKDAEIELENSLEQLKQSQQQHKSSEGAIEDLREELREALESAGQDESDVDSTRLDELQSECNDLREQLLQQTKDHEAEVDSENARLIQQVSKLNDELDTQQAELAELQAQSELTAAETGDSDSQAEIDALNDKLARAESDLQESNASHQNEVDAMRAQLAETLETITQLRQQHESMQASQVEAGETHQADSQELSQLESRHDEISGQLEQTLDEVDRLRIQNAQLTDQLQAQSDPGTRPHVSFNQESLSWEERKKLIMQQLEDDGDEALAAQEAKLEIEDILQTTESEIARRDREIAELQSIVEQQSDTKQGVAIGAAAIAQMFESDELIVEEREKLKGIQGEWEEKVRQAEIDISMERAKLARERSQIESKVEELERRLSEVPDKPGDASRPQVRTRKWLDHLGLREEREE